MQVRRSTYYHYNNKPKQSLIEKENEILKPLVLEIFEKSKKRFGSIKVRIKLIELGFTISQKRVSKLMKELNITCQFHKVQIKYPKANRNLYLKNKLKQKFQKNSPNQGWVSDITTIKVNYVNHFLCVIIDLFSRKIIYSNLSHTANTDLVRDTFSYAYEQRDKPISLMFHSDRGTQYTAYQFRKLLRDFNVIQSFSNTAYPYDNSVAESFFASLKKEQLNREIFMTVSHLQNTIDEYIDFYNNERPHQTLNYFTPNQFEQNYYDKNKSTDN